MNNPPPSWQRNDPADNQPPANQQPYSSPEQQGPGPRMIRVRRPTRRPTVTYGIMAVTIFVYLLQLATNAGILQGPFLALGRIMFGDQIFQQLLDNGWGSALLVLLGGKISPLIVAGQYWRLITPVLLHDSSFPYGLLHIGFNMYAVYVIGAEVEGYYGHWRYLVLYLLGGLGGNILSFLMTPGPTPSIGASTAIFGLIAAEGVFIYQNRSIFGPRARAMLNNIIAIIVINLAIGLSPAIDNWGHLGGLITGLVFGWFAGPRMEITYNYPEYELVDQRSPSATWLVGIVIFVILMGIAFLRVSLS